MTGKKVKSEEKNFKKKPVHTKLPNVSTKIDYVKSFTVILGSWSLLEKSDLRHLGVQSRLTLKWQAKKWSFHVF